jgi:hypothetical protein
MPSTAKFMMFMVRKYPWEVICRLTDIVFVVGFSLLTIYLLVVRPAHSDTVPARWAAAELPTGHPSSYRLILYFKDKERMAMFADSLRVSAPSHSTVFHSTLAALDDSTWTLKLLPVDHH